MKIKIIRNTWSVCPKCIRKIKADIIEENGKVYMFKKCKKHGSFKILLSSYSKWYKELSNFYFSFHPSFLSSNFKQKYWQLMVTYRCNLKCPVCFTSGFQKEELRKELTLEEIKELMKSFKGVRMSCFGGEPTVREDLPEIIRIIRENKSIPILYTNGIKLANYSYLKKLKECGLEDVHLQFDGFDDKVYEFLRRKKLVKIKLKALKNLKKLHVATSLETTIPKNLGEKGIKKILDFAVKNNFISAVFFRPYNFLSRVGSSYNNSLRLDEIIDILEKETKGKVSREKILEFLKFFYVFNYIFPYLIKWKPCFFGLYFLIFREKNGYKTVDEIFNLRRIQPTLEKIRRKKEKNNILIKLYFLFSLPKILTKKSLSSLPALLKFTVKALMQKVFTYSCFPQEFLLITVHKQCEAEDFEWQFMPYCHPGEIWRKGIIFHACGLADRVRDRWTFCRPC